MRFDLRAKLSRMGQIKRERPAYRELLEFYERIYIEKERCAHALKARLLQVDEEAIRHTLGEGTPAMDKATITLDIEESSEFFHRLLALACEKNPQTGPPLARYLRDEREVRSLLEELWRGDLSTEDWEREAIGDPSLLVFLLIESLKPMYEYVAGMLAGFIDAEQWMRGYCPVCGAVPPIGEIAGKRGARSLFCGCCGMEWYYPELRCPFCRGAGGQKSSYHYIKNEKPYRIEVCRDCNRYLKMVDTECLGFRVPLDVEHLGTLHLDMLAQQEGYQRGTPLPLLI